MSKQKIKRIYHTWDKWECYPSGFYENQAKGMTREECEKQYKKLFTDTNLFEKALNRVVTEWKNSCEHYLTNEKMNRIAWLGQASLCIEYGIPSCYRSGYFRLSKKEREVADKTALKYLNLWLKKNGYNQVDLVDAGIRTHANIY